LKVAGKFDLKDFDLNSRGIGATFYLDGNDSFNTLMSILGTMERASTEIAQPRFGVPDISMNAALKVENTKKGLKPIEDARMIVDEFERNCGIASLMKSNFVNKLLNYLVEKDPAYVESVLKKCWLTDEFHPFSFIATLPKLLLKLNHSESVIATHALQLLNSEDLDDQNYGIELMLAVSEASTKDLPIAFDQIKKILLNPEFDSDYDSFEHGLKVLEAIMLRGQKLEQFAPNLFQLLTSENTAVSNNGLKALDIFTKHRNNYSNKFKEELAREIQQLVLPIAIRPLIETRLTALMKT
ncbi:MAG TPA: hypothetical protein VGP47_06130, partial [Parachlamydiaceae bacterium]|nr:hypothetical protein [Parachlamydiaceae bacterium]